MRIIETLDFSGQHFYIGNDVHKKNWTVTIRTGNMELKTMSIDPNPEKLSEYMKKNYPNGTYHSVYEAGFSGYETHRRLCEHGFDNIVVSPADVPTTNKEKSRKTDRIDSRKLSRELSNGSLVAIYVPDEYHQQLRSFARLRYTLSKEQTRIKNRIKSFLMYYGIETPPNEEMQHWSRNFINWLSNLKFKYEPANNTLSELIEILENTRKSLTKTLKNLRQFCYQNPEAKKIIELIRSIPGIGFITAVTFYTEIIDIKRFNSTDRLLSYIGLVPSESSSGDREKVRGLTKRKKSYLVYLIIEDAWMAIRYDPVMTQKYNELKKRMKGQEAIIHIAKKIVSRIRFVWANEQTYKSLQVEPKVIVTKNKKVKKLILVKEENLNKG